MNHPVSKAIVEARNVLELREVLWHATHVHWKHVASNTQCQWQNRALACAEYFVDLKPLDGFWIYNTIFTFLRPEQQDRLLDRVKRRYKQHARPNAEQHQIGTEQAPR